MLITIKEFFLTRFESDVTDNKSEKTLEIATAALMLEISMADSSVSKTELKVINHAIQNAFSLSDTESQELISLAEQQVDHSVSIYEFTRLLNEKLNREERVKIIELLWKVAFADNVLDKHEEYYVRKIADLLYVSHSDYIKAKLRAEKEND